MKLFARLQVKCSRYGRLRSILKYIEGHGALDPPRIRENRKADLFRIIRREVCWQIAALSCRNILHRSLHYKWRAAWSFPEEIREIWRPPVRPSMMKDGCRHEISLPRS